MARKTLPVQLTPARTPPTPLVSKLIGREYGDCHTVSPMASRFRDLDGHASQVAIYPWGYIGGMNTYRVSVGLVAIFSLAAIAGCQQTSPEPVEDSSVVTEESVELDNSNESDAATSVENLAPGSNEAIAWEALMGPDGEYAAAASYQAVLDEFGPVEPYKTIKAAEERHIDALIRQLQRYGIDVPANPYLGQLEAPADLETAAREWAVGEIANVEMYDDLIAQADDRQLIRVLENLRRASLESHLPAFEAAAENGGTLDPGSMSGN